MKKALIFAVLLFFGLKMHSNNVVNPNEVKTGDIVTIGTPVTHTYSTLKFPKSNFIIKRGGIVNYSDLAGVKVEVVAVKEKADGSREVTLKRQDGRKFFNVLPTVTANLDKAVSINEIL